MITTKKSGTVLVFSAAILLAIWPLPNTMGARHLMLLTGFIAAAFILLPNRHVFNSRQAWPIYFFFSLNYFYDSIKLIKLTYYFVEKFKCLLRLHSG